MVYLYLFPYNGLPYYHLHDTGILDEPETLYMDEQAQPASLAVRLIKQARAAVIALNSHRSFQ
jgi:hypothetical protein